MTTIELVEEEMARATRIHPESVDLIRFVGAASVKLSSIQSKIDHHAIAADQKAQRHTRMALLQLAVISLRAIEHLGGIAADEYYFHSQNTETADRSFES